SLSYGVVRFIYIFFFSSRRRHTRSKRDWSSDVCSSDLARLRGWGIIADLHPELLQMFYDFSPLKHRIKSISLVNSKWNSNAIKSLSLEKELALKLVHGKISNELCPKGSFPYMNVQDGEAPQPQDSDLKSDWVFDHDHPFLLTVPKQVQERHASNVVRMFPMVQTLHLWSVNPS